MSIFKSSTFVSKFLKISALGVSLVLTACGPNAQYTETNDEGYWTGTYSTNGAPDGTQLGKISAFNAPSPAFPLGIESQIEIECGPTGILMVVKLPYTNTDFTAQYIAGTAYTGSPNMYVTGLSKFDENTSVVVPTKAQTRYLILESSKSGFITFDTNSPSTSVTYLTSGLQVAFKTACGWHPEYDRFAY